MTDTIHCSEHGETRITFVCEHLAAGCAGRGFHCGEATTENPFPDAWCDSCDSVQAQFGGWNEQSEGKVKISLLCTECYRLARRRNVHTSPTLKDLNNYRWKCHACEEWHLGAPLDFGFDSPYFWEERDSNPEEQTSIHYLTDDYCVIEGRDYFVRGIIKLPVIGTDEFFSWGVWGSLKKENFDLLRGSRNHHNRSELLPMFSWLSNKIENYPDTLNLKMYAHPQQPDLLPIFQLEQSEHPLAVEQREGIHPEKIRAILLAESKEITQIT